MNRRVKIPLLYDGFFSFAVVRQIDTLPDDMSDTGMRIVAATAREIAEVEEK